MNRIVLPLILFAVVVLLAGCRGPIFGINLLVVGERTALERQVLGTYAEIGQDLSTYASVRGVAPDGSLRPAPELTDSQAAVLSAMNNRSYNRDDLNTMLLAGVVGEGNDGRLRRLEDRPLSAAGLPEDLAAQVILEENRDREIIIQRLVKTTPGISPGDAPEVAWIFSTLNHDLAPPGSLIEQRDGQWRRK